jgi:uncharacterized membrane protein
VSRSEHPFSERPPEDLTDREWRVLTSWRLNRVEATLDSIQKALWTIAGGIIIGVAVFFLTTGHG